MKITIELDVSNERYTFNVPAFFLLLKNALDFNGVEITSILRDYSNETLLEALQNGRDIGFTKKGK